MPNSRQQASIASSTILDYSIDTSCLLSAASKQQTEFTEQTQTAQPPSETHMYTPNDNIDASTCTR